ncbi:hypothetical protein Ocin01_09739 [Orchesella cincta]|uniref:Uncharacterized protein n=1 Tax=Orchesella cincta TaxID=48709 RepID=A0A1D2MV09_ORCCI|nr:hypothetical protein Ocin01_09739 [Orchesella cincta]
MPIEATWRRLLYKAHRHPQVPSHPYEQNGHQFQTARNNQPSQEAESVSKTKFARYVGDDVFGNYHMIKTRPIQNYSSESSTQTQPEHRASEEASFARKPLA